MIPRQVGAYLVLGLLTSCSMSLPVVIDTPVKVTLMIDGNVDRLNELNAKRLSCVKTLNEMRKDGERQRDLSDTLFWLGTFVGGTSGIVTTALVGAVPADQKTAPIITSVFAIAGLGVMAGSRMAESPNVPLSRRLLAEQSFKIGESSLWDKKYDAAIRSYTDCASPASPTPNPRGEPSVPTVSLVPTPLPVTP